MHNATGSGAGAVVDAIDPALWGKSFWDTLHYAAAGYPVSPSDERQKSATMFFSSFADVLPCNECRDHATAYVKAKPPSVTSKDALLKWTLDFHNAVNVKLGMPQLSLGAIRVKYLPRAVAAPTSVTKTPAPLARAPVALPKAPAPVTRKAPQPATRAMGLNTRSAQTKTTRGPIAAVRNGTNTATRDPVPSRPRGPRPARKRCGCSG
jgi:hypothetical protein